MGTAQKFSTATFVLVAIVSFLLLIGVLTTQLMRQPSRIVVDSAVPRLGLVLEDDEEFINLLNSEDSLNSIDKIRVVLTPSEQNLFSRDDEGEIIAGFGMQTSDNDLAVFIYLSPGYLAANSERVDSFIEPTYYTLLALLSHNAKVKGEPLRMDRFSERSLAFVDQFQAQKGKLPITIIKL